MRVTGRNGHHFRLLRGLKLTSSVTCITCAIYTEYLRWVFLEGTHVRDCDVCRIAATPRARVERRQAVGVASSSPGPAARMTTNELIALFEARALAGGVA